MIAKELGGHAVHYIFKISKMFFLRIDRMWEPSFRCGNLRVWGRAGPKGMANGWAADAETLKDGRLREGGSRVDRAKNGQPRQKCFRSIKTFLKGHCPEGGKEKLFLALIKKN